MAEARQCLELGDRDHALVAIDAALAIDPEFLAAQSLRESILANSAVYRPPAANAAVAGVMSATRRAVPEQIVEARPPEIAAPPRPDPVAVQPPSHAASNGDTPLVLRAEDQPAAEPARAVEAAQDLPLRVADAPTVPGVPAAYAKFEQRAKRRRVDHRLDAARAAIEKGRLHDAAAALNEVLNLDPNAPELAALTASFNKLQRSERRPRRSRWLVAAVAFGATMLGASWLEQQQALRSRPMDVIAGLISSPQPVASSPQPVALPEGPPPAEAAPDAEAIGTSGLNSGAVPSPSPDAATPASAAVVPRVAPLPETPIEPLLNSVGPVPVSRNTDPEVVSPPPPVTPSPSVPAAVPAVDRTASPAPVAVPPPQPAVDEAALVRQTLQRYRVAYDGLDAGSARAVWPAVDQDALARAFQGLESQTLTFDACDVQLQSGSANATCRGSASYVPKVGNRERRTEPRVWTFALRKTGGEWKIATARVER